MTTAFENKITLEAVKRDIVLVRYEVGMSRLEITTRTTYAAKLLTANISKIKDLYEINTQTQVKSVLINGEEVEIKILRSLEHETPAEKSIEEELDLISEDQDLDNITLNLDFVHVQKRIMKTIIFNQEKLETSIFKKYRNKKIIEKLEMTKEQVRKLLAEGYVPKNTKAKIFIKKHL